MLKKLCGALAALALSFAPATAAPQDADPALWVVKDEDTTIYLFGTVHAMKPGLSWFDEAVKSAFDSSDELVLELVEPPAAELMALVTKLAVRKDGKTLSETLPEATREKLGKALAGFGLPANGLDKYEPWFATVMLSGLMLPKLGYDPAQGADKQLAAAAGTAGKTVEGFETAEEQLGIFEAAPEDVQIAYLGEVLDTLDETGPKIDTIIALWSEGKPDALGDAMNAEMAKTPALAKRLLADRNARWVETIAKRMDAPGTVFVAVGAGHLGGQGNVRELLAARGLKAERIAY